MCAHTFTQSPHMLSKLPKLDFKTSAPDLSFSSCRCVKPIKTEVGWREKPILASRIQGVRNKRPSRHASFPEGKRGRKNWAACRIEKEWGVLFRSNGKNIYESCDRGQLMETKSLNTLLADSSHTPSKLGSITREILLFLRS